MVGEIKVEGNNIIFQLQGIDKILAIKSAIKVPIEHITDVSTERADWNLFKQLRIAGTDFPGKIKEGRFLSKEGLLFYEMRDPDKCITVSLKDERYKKIIFEVENKETTAELLRNLIQKGS